MKVHSLSIDSSQRDSTLYPHANTYVITLENPIYDVEEIQLMSAYIPTPQTPSPNSIILRLSSGSDEFNQSVYVGVPKDSNQKGTPHYTGHILLNGGTSIMYNGSDDPLIHRFHSGSQKSISELGIEFLYLNNGILTQYDFGNADHTLKFKITCSTDKLEVSSKIPYTDKEPESVPEPQISIPEVGNSYEWKHFVHIGIIVLIGILLMILMRRRKPV